MSSAWELDERLTTPCRLCGEEPERTVVLHYDLPVAAHGGAALCAACVAAAESGDEPELRRRGLTLPGPGGLPRERPALVRAILAWGGHPLPAPPSDPGSRLGEADQEVWRELRARVLAGPTVPVSGRIDHPGAENPWDRVWWDGSRLRLDDADGSTRFTTDDVRIWEREGDRMVVHPVPRRRETPRPWFSGHALQAVQHAVAEAGPPTTLEPRTHLGRPAWHLRLPSGRVLVDAATGLVVERQDGGRVLSRWTELVVGVEPDAEDVDHFVYRGPCVTGEQVRREQDREHEADGARRAAWFRAHVTPVPLEVDDRVLAPWVHEWDEAGSFTASLDHGSTNLGLTRRPRSSDWWPVGSSGRLHRWSDETWDWALTDSAEEAWGEEPLSVAAIEQLRRAVAGGPA